MKYFDKEKLQATQSLSESEHIVSEQDALKIKDNLTDQSKIENLTQKPKIERPPKLYDLTTIQRYGLPYLSIFECYTSLSSSLFIVQNCYSFTGKPIGGMGSVQRGL